MANIAPSDVDYINCHSTSTPVGDGIESDTIDAIFHSSISGSSRSRSNDRPLFVSSTKGATGHLLGAAGAVETVFSCLALRDNIVPPTRGLRDPKPLPKAFLHNAECIYLSEDSNATGTSRNRQLKVAVKNSFGFGGTNAVLCIKKYEA